MNRLLFSDQKGVLIMRNQVSKPRITLLFFKIKYDETVNSALARGIVADFRKDSEEGLITEFEMKNR